MASPNSNWLCHLKRDYGTSLRDIFLNKLRLKKLKDIAVEICTNGRLQKAKYILKECGNGKKHYLADGFFKEIKWAYKRRDFSRLEAQATHIILDLHAQEDMKSPAVQPSQRRRRRSPASSSSEESDYSSDESSGDESDHIDYKHNDSDEEYIPPENNRVGKNVRKTHQSNRHKTLFKPIQKRRRKSFDTEEEFDFGEYEKLFDIVYAKNEDSKSQDSTSVSDASVVSMDVDSVADNQNKRKEVPSDEETDVQVFKKPKLD